MEKILAVALGGSLGALSRYGTALLAARFFGDRFPLGTLAVNLTGCFLIGLMFSLGNERSLVSPLFRLFFVTGFLGALTTFSTYGIESVNFARNGMFDVSLLNIGLNNIIGFALVMLGIWIGKII